MWTYFAFAFLWFFRLLPFAAQRAFSFFLSYPAYFLAQSRRNVGLKNLELAFPESELTWRKKIIRQNMEHMLNLLFEYGTTWYSSEKTIQSRVTINNLDIILNLQKAGQRVIVFYPHFTGLELGLYGLNPHLPVVSIYSKQKNPIFDRAIYKGRHRYGKVFLVSRQESLRSIVKAIKKHNAPLCYLPDQDFGAEASIFVPFFAVEKTATITGLPRLAKLADAHVVPVIATRTKQGITVDCYPAWENYPTDDVIADTRRMNAFLEARILENPSQYFWLHKRFKSRPDGEAYFY
ncbi:MAG: lipid A biosynthesis lauroyl acyltransferase [Neisseriaceae bacterium]|nr:lipid A biosynthesis lauroyl acyltransferase [Neisseriaceae bacterium]